MMHENPDSVLDRFRANVLKFPNKLAVAFLRSVVGPNGCGCEIQDQKTYQELDEETTQLAKALLLNNRLISPGDR